jgi:hypothetical protein
MKSVTLTAALLATLTAARAGLLVFPNPIVLSGKDARQSLVVQWSASPEAPARDVTGEAVMAAAEPSLVVPENGVLRALADGATALTISAQGESLTVPVEVRSTAAARAVSFRLDVLPVFLRAGCNSGSCHGAGRGQDGFRLSLFGFDPAGDYFRLTQELIGRRLNFASPEKSLLLEKATGAVAHTGGECFKPGSPLYATLHHWIADGAPDDPPETPTVTGIRMLPPRILLKASATQPPGHRTVVMADYSDGSTRDVTSLALFLSNNEASATVSRDGVLTATNSGGAWVFGRFDKFTAGSEIIVLPESDDFAWPEAVTPVNFIDDAVFARLRQFQIPPSPPADDATFLRRLRLDLTGLPPSPEELASFCSDTSQGKRDALIDRLLASPEFTDVWTMKWAEVLQIRANSNNNVDTGRPRRAAYKYYQWLRTQIAANRPFQEVVRDLIRGEGSNLANPTANFYTTAFGNPRKPMERAEDTAQLFLGTRIQCAQCHHHPFDRWTMDDYYGFTAFFSGISQKRGAAPTEVHVFCQPEKHTAEHPVDGRQAKPRFLGGGEPDLAGGDPRHFLADWLTSPENKPFARTLANRAWAHFFGRGIIEPVDDGRLSNPPSNEELLASLARHLAASQFNVRSLIREICRSRTYQLSSSTSPANAADDRYFSHAMVRRLQAEILVDSIGAVTGVPATFSGQPQGTRATGIFDGGADRDYFLKTFGASRRETVCACEVRSEPTLTQALHLINGATIDAALLRSPMLSELAASPKSPEEAVGYLFRRTLSREATGYEMARFLERSRQVDPGDRKALRTYYSDVLWALLNTTEFAFNH